MISAIRNPKALFVGCIKHVFLGFFILIFLMISSSALAAPMEVFVSVGPQKWLADRIGGKLISTHVLVGKGQDPHTFEPAPRQVAALSRANLYFTIGMPFEKGVVGKIKKNMPNLKLVDSASAIQRKEMDEVGGPVGHDKSHKHFHDTSDPHIWLSPVNLNMIAQVMANAMSVQDPEHSEMYKENLYRLQASLNSLHRDIASRLAPHKGETFYVFHPAFGYFAEAYGLHQEAVEIEGKSPSPRQLSRLIERARSDSVRIIFVQMQFETKSAAVIADAIGGQVVVLDPLAEDVSANLEKMAEQIEGALSH